MYQELKKGSALAGLKVIDMGQMVAAPFCTSVLADMGADAYLKHYFPEEGTLKVFIRGGSTFTLDLTTGNGLFESVRKRTVLSAFNRLHYNPSRWWTIFSDIFLAGLLVIVATGLVMVRGRNGLAGRGGAELAAGILVPLLFIFLT